LEKEKNAEERLDFLETWAYGLTSFVVCFMLTLVVSGLKGSFNVYDLVNLIFVFLFGLFLLIKIEGRL